MNRLALLLWIAMLSAAAAQPPLPDFGYQQKPGSQLPASAMFHDETGRSVRLSALAGRRPMILALGYFHCPNLCGIVRDDLLNAVTNSGLQPGRDYTLVFLSIDPAETPGDAAAAKSDDIARYPSMHADARHYLTGEASAIQAVATAVGFRDRFDPQLKQFLHPSGIVFISPDAHVAGYLLGVGYAPGDVRLGITRAATGSVMRSALPILLLCFHYDPVTGRYTLAITRLLEIASALTVLTIGATIALALRREASR
jgi:protein SCO1/2